LAVPGNVTIFSAYANNPRDWTQKELAEFYRVENALIQAGMRVTTEQGLTDEGEPWFIFCRTIDNEPVVHFARIDGQYVIVSEAFDAPVKGHDFHAMILSLLRRHRLNSTPTVSNSNVFVHPAALLIAVVGVAFFKTLSPAKAADSGSDANLPAKAAAATGAVQAQTNGSDPVRAAGVTTKAHASDTESWAEQSLRIAIATIASLSEAEVAAAKQSMDQASALALALETGTPIKIQANNNNAHEALDAAYPIIPSPTQEAGSSLASNNLLNQDAPKLDPVLIGTALSMIQNLAKVPAAADTSHSTLTLQINQTHLGFNAAEAPVPVFVNSSQATIFKTEDITNHLSSLNQVSPTSSAQDHVFSAAQPITKTITISIANLSAFTEAPSFGGIVAFEINLKAIDESSSTSFLTKNNIQLLSQTAVPSLITTDITEINGVSLRGQTNADQSDTYNFNYTQVSSSSFSDSSNTFVSNAQIPTPTSIQDTQTVISTAAPTTQAGVVDAAGQATQPAVIAPIHLSLSTIQSVQGATFAASLIQFINDVPGIKVSVSESNNYAFYNPADISAHNTPLGEITLSFNDGSSISIIGQKAEIDSISSSLF
jgi:hypothetical protein